MCTNTQNSAETRPANTAVKDPMVNSLGFVGHGVWAERSPLSSRGAEAAQAPVLMKGHGQVPTQLYLCTLKLKFHILFTGHAIQLFL